MKYEMIFGDDDFSGQSNGLAEVKLWHDCFGPKFVSLEELHCMNAGHAIPHGTVVLAMRRIIKEPKRWTWEDKKAGRLPEVGAKCSHCHSIDERNVLSVTDKYVGIECDNSDMNPYFVTHAEFIQYYIPIETQAEKAQREEDEFINSMLAKGVVYMSDYIEGLRAAYRKLKGGE